MIIKMAPYSKEFDLEDYLYFIFWKILCCVAQRVIYKFFCWGSNKPKQRCVSEYFKNDLGMKARDFEKKFNKNFQNEIMKDPTGKSFDIPLLYAIIKCSFDFTDAEVDVVKVIKEINDIRSTHVHEIHNKFDKDHFQKIIETLKCKLDIVLEEGGKFYKQDPSVIIYEKTEMKNDIDNISKSRIAHPDIEKYQNDMKIQKKIIDSGGFQELLNNVSESSNIDPGSFILGSFSLKVRDVYTKLEIVHHNKAPCPSNKGNLHEIQYEDLLTLKTHKGEMAQYVIIEGPPGAGKSALEKLIKAEWSDLQHEPPRKASVKQLDDFKVVLPVQCRNSNICSFPELLVSLMPQLSLLMNDEDLVQSVLSTCAIHESDDLNKANKILILVDGIDEWNFQSKRLLEEILEMYFPLCGKNITIVFTTRPEMIKEVEDLLPKNATWVHTRLMGVSDSRIIEFVTRLHEAMIEAKESSQSTAKLVEYILFTLPKLGHHWRLPLNLTLLTVLWAKHPEKVNSITTSTRLYAEIETLIIEKLIKRLIAQNFCNCNHNRGYDEYKKACLAFREELYHTCLKAHIQKVMIIPKDLVAHLAKKCEELHLPQHEMLGAFMSIEMEWTPNGYEHSLVMCHKSMGEYFAANALCDILSGKIKSINETQQDTKRLEHTLRVVDKGTKKLIIETYEKDHIQIQNTTISGALTDLHKISNVIYDPKYHLNLLLHLAGVMKYRKMFTTSSNHRHTFSKEIIEILEVVGMSSQRWNRWLDLITEVECDTSIVEAIATKMQIEVLEISDGQVTAALSLLPHLRSLRKVSLRFSANPRSLPMIEELLNAMAFCNVGVWVQLQHDWQHTTQHTSDSLIEKIVDKSCKLTAFRGSLSSAHSLSNSLIYLALQLQNNQQAQEIIPKLRVLAKDHNLKQIRLHVVSLSVDPSSVVQPLPVLGDDDMSFVWLHVSQVSDDHIDWLLQIVTKLMPLNGYSKICFPCCKMSMEGFHKVLAGLNAVKILEGVDISSPHITAQHEKQLKQDANKLAPRISLFRYDTDKDIFGWKSG